MWAWSCLTEARERQRDRSVEIAAAAKAVVLVEAAGCIPEGGVAVDKAQDFVKEILFRLSCGMKLLQGDWRTKVLL
jgi:hypothetical protein